MHNKKKVVFLANSFSFLSYYKLTLSRLIAESCSVTWAFPGPFDKSDISKMSINLDDISIYPLKTSRSGLSSFVGYTTFLLRSLISDRPNLFISHTVYPNLASLLVFFIVRPSDTKLALFITGFGPSRIRNSLRIRFLGRLYLSLLRITASKFDNIFIYTLNSSDLNQIQDFKTSRNCTLVRESGVTSEDLVNGLNPSRDKLINIRNGYPLRVLFFGRFLLEKGIHDFVVFSNYLKGLSIPLHLKIAGSYDANTSSVSSYWLSSFIDCNSVEVVTDVDYSSVFSSADVLVFPSYREGHPMFLLRAMSFGVVPIVYDVPGSTVDVIHMHNGLVSPSFSPSGLVSSLLLLEQDRSLFADLSANARSYACKNSQLVADRQLYSILSLLLYEN